MMDNKNVSLRDSAQMLKTAWTITAIFGVFFFPVGVVLLLILFIRIYHVPEKLEQYVLNYGIVAVVLSSSMLLFAGLAFQIIGLSGEKENSFSIASVLLILAPGVLFGILMIIAFFILKKRKYLYDSCYMLVQKEHIVSLQTISSILGTNDKKTRKLMQSLIKNGKFGQATIDEQTQELLLEKSIWAKQHVVCDNCGAELVVDFGHTLTCAYCGSALKARIIESF